MPFLILSCPAPVPRHHCEDRIRDLLSVYGEVGGVLIASRLSDQDPWTAAVEMRSGHDAAVAALKDAQIDGHTLRIRTANAIDVQMLRI
jgi:hypothetical protein